MTGMDGIGGATKVTVQDPQGNGGKGSVPAVEVQAAVPAIAGGIGPKDKYHPGPPAPLSPPHPTTYCTLPLPPPIDPKQEARDLVNPVLHSSGAERLEAYRKFTENVKFASTAALKEALKLLDELSHNIAWTCTFPVMSYNRQIAQLLRKNIEADLKTRPQEPEEEARELIDGVVDTEGAEQLEAFVKFVGELKKATRATLEEVRDQLVDQMAGESDAEQRLVYKLMLHAVNKEMDERNTRPHGFPGRQSPGFFPPPPAVPLQFTQEEHSLLQDKLSVASTGTRAAIKAFAGIQEQKDR